MQIKTLLEIKQLFPPSPVCAGHYETA